ncbi:MAG TPA: PAS domain-containing protein, partial [Alphaproteobacteria bacterium]|nr:PAS domain-containing protein [Alphaproteobacteria bacterium]
MSAAAADFLSGGGALGALIRAHDWASTPLGPPAAWPSPLRTLVGIMLGSGQPMFVAWGPERIMLYNDGYAPLCGARHPWALGRRFEELWADIIDAVGPIMDRAYAGVPTHMDDIAFVMHRNGYPEEAHFAFSYTPVRQADGAVAGVFCACSETTEKVRAERALRESNAALAASREALEAANARLSAEGERLRRLFHDAPGFMCVLRGPDHVYEMANAAYLQLVGHRDVVGKPLLAVLPEVADQGFIELLDRTRATGEPFIGNGVPVQLQRSRTGSLEERFVDFVFQPIFEADGTVGGIFVEGSDVTEAKRAEAALRASEAQLRALNETLERRVGEAIAERQIWADIVENTDALVAVLGPDFRYRAVNRAYADEFARIYGPRPAVGDSLAELLAELPEHRAEAEAVWARALGGESFVLVAPFGDEGRARRHYELRFAPISDRDGGVVGAFQYALDVTERLRSQTQLAAAQEALRQSQKMEAIGQLTGGVAHDFNNLLTVIRSSADLLRRPELPEDRRRRYVDAIADTAERAAKLTGQLLAFARRQALTPKVFDAAGRVRSVADMLRSLLGSQIRLLIEADRDGCHVEADPSQFETALVNLAVNARDAMAEGGTLRIGVGLADCVPATRGHAAAHGAFVRVSVADSGVGIAPEAMDRIFEPFFTTKEVGQGTGLGLSQVFGFAKQSGGEVLVDSRPGGGATFTLYLPRAARAEEADPPAPAQPLLSGGRVLVVEDNTAVGAFAVELLEDLGHAAVWVANAQAALDRLAAGDRFDVVFTDVVMPGMSG